MRSGERSGERPNDDAAKRVVASGLGYQPISSVTSLGLFLNFLQLVKKKLIGGNCLKLTKKNLPDF